MDTNRSNQTIKSILLFTGAFTFVFLLGEMVHELGHYLCHLAYGNTAAQVHLDPFGSSRIMGASSQTAKTLGVTSAAGPLLNLVLGITSFVLLWRNKRPVLLPLILWGPVAMIQEGVTFSLGLLTPGGDAEWIATLGIPKALILAFGILLLIGGLGMLASLLTLVGIERDESYKMKAFVVVVSMGSLMLIRSVHSFLVNQDAILENLIPFVFSLVLAVIVGLLHRPIAELSGRISSIEPLSITWSVSALALLLGGSMFTLQLLLP